MEKDREKIQNVKHIMAELFCEHGGCCFDVEHISKCSNIPASELADEDRGGILDRLCDDGFLVSAGYPPCFSLSSESVEFNL